MEYREAGISADDILVLCIEDKPLFFFKDVCVTFDSVGACFHGLLVLSRGSISVEFYLFSFSLFPFLFKFPLSLFRSYI